MITLNDEQQYVVINALRVAALRFDDHVQFLTVDHPSRTDYTKLATQFAIQASEARRLADLIEADGEEPMGQEAERTFLPDGNIRGFS